MKYFIILSLLLTCLSTHWVGTFDIVNNPIPGAFVRYLATNLAEPGSMKICAITCLNKTAWPGI